MPTPKRKPGRPSETYPPECRAIRLEDWPEQDRLAFDRARRHGDDAFDIAGPAAHLKEQTWRAYIQSYGQMLNYLNRHNLLLLSEGPGDRLTPERLTLLLTDTKQRLAPISVKQMLKELYLMFSVMEPRRDWRWIVRHPERPSEREIRAARRPKLTFDLRALCAQALDLMDQIKDSPFEIELIFKFRDALIVAFQCTFALRRRNLAEMAVGRNVIFTDDVIHLIFATGETKNFLPIKSMIPEFLAPYVRKYFYNHRPVLLDGRLSDAFWINYRHGRLDYGAFSHIFEKAGTRLLGRPITCHTFRYAAATTILRQDPRLIRVASGVLGHEGLRTTNRYYDRSGEEGSRRVWEKVRRDIVRGRRS